MQEEGSGVDIGPAASHVCHRARFSYVGLACVVVPS